MKENIYIQLHEGEKEIGYLKNEAKNEWKSAGNKVKDIETVDFYIKPDEKKCYYLINKEFNGSIDLV